MGKTRGRPPGKKSTRKRPPLPQRKRHYKAKSVNQLQQEERTIQKYMPKYEEMAASATKQGLMLQEDPPSFPKKGLFPQEQYLLLFPKGEDIPLKEQTSAPLIETAFKTLDRLSTLLNGPITQITQRAFDDLFVLVARVKSEMPLQHIHNLQYTNRLSYIASIAQQKFEGYRSVNMLNDLVQAQVARVQGLYRGQFQNWAFLDKIMKEYTAQT